MCGARKPRLTDPTMVQVSSGVTTAAARKVTSRDRQGIVGPERRTVDDRAVGGARFVARAAKPQGADEHGRDRARLVGGLRVHAALPEGGAIRHARTPRRHRAGDTGLTLNASDVSFSKYTSPPTVNVCRCDSCEVRAPCTPFTVVRSGSWPMVAVGLPLPPWLTRSSRWLLTRIGQRRVLERAEVETLDARREEIQAEAVQFGDEVAIAAEQLVVTVATVLERPLIRSDEAR